MPVTEKAIVLYLAASNLITFFTYGIDKYRAKKELWRISEKTLFLLPLFGGSVGAIAGMKFFRHKTKHWYFRYGLPLILLAQIALCAWLYLK